MHVLDRVTFFSPPFPHISIAPKQAAFDESDNNTFLQGNSLNGHK